MVREGPWRRKHWGRDLKKGREHVGGAAEHRPGNPRSISEPDVEGDDET